eukprot:gene20866-7751_t
MSQRNKNAHAISRGHWLWNRIDSETVISALCMKMTVSRLSRVAPTPAHLGEEDICCGIDPNQKSTFSQSVDATLVEKSLVSQNIFWKTSASPETPRKLVYAGHWCHNIFNRIRHSAGLTLC